MVMDIARRPPGTFEKFSSLMKKYFNSTIMDDLLIATSMFFRISITTIILITCSLKQKDMSTRFWLIGQGIV